MKISDYMPNLYKNNVEMTNIIYSEEDELEIYLKFDIDGGFADNFIKTATIHGIEKYEELLDIMPDNTLTTEERRQQVIVKLLASVPYTYRKLCEILDGLFGKGGYKIEQDFNNYTMTIMTEYLNEHIARLTLDILKYIIPANIEWAITLFQDEEINKYFATVMHTGDYIYLGEVS